MDIDLLGAREKFQDHAHATEARRAVSSIAVHSIGSAREKSRYICRTPSAYKTFAVCVLPESSELRGT